MSEECTQGESTAFVRSEHVLHTSTSAGSLPATTQPENEGKPHNAQTARLQLSDLDVYPLLSMILDIYERDRLYNNSLFLGKIYITSYWRWPIIGKGASFLVRKAAVLSDPSAAVGGRFVSSRRATNRSDKDGHFSVPPLVTKQLLIPQKASVRKDAQKLLDSVALELCVLSHHPLAMHENIVDLYGIQWDLDEDQRIWPVLVVEEAQFGTLASLQRNTPSLDYSTKLELSLDIALGLEAIHACGIVHSDVKSENCLIFRHPQRKYIAKLGDFGCSVVGLADKEVDIAALTLRGYTPLWAAPELQNTVKPRMLFSSDIFSFGLLVWTVMINGKSIFADLAAQAPDYLQQINALKAGCGLIERAEKQFLSSNGGDADGKDILGVLYQTLQPLPANRSLTNAVAMLKSFTKRQANKQASPFRPIKNPFPETKSSQVGPAVNVSVPSKASQWTNFSSLQLDLLHELDHSIQAYFLRHLTQAMEDLNSLSPLVESRESRDYDTLLIMQAQFALQGIGQPSLADYINAVPTQNAEHAFLVCVAEGSPGFGPPKYNTVRKFNVTAALNILRIAADRGNFEAKALWCAIAMAYRRHNSFDETVFSWIPSLMMIGHTNLLKTDDMMEKEFDRETAKQEALDLISSTTFQVKAMTIMVQDGSSVAKVHAHLEREMKGDEIVDRSIWGDAPDGKLNWRTVAELEKQKLARRDVADLHMAAQIGTCGDALATIIANYRGGAGINTKDELGNTPLITACRYGRLETALALIERGADPQILGPRKISPIHFLSAFRKAQQQQIADALVDHGAGVNVLAEGLGLEEELFISSPLLILTSEISGSPLHLAVLENNLSAVQILVKLGADPLLTNRAFISPLSLAANLNCSEILELFLDSTGVDVGKWTDHHGNRLVLSALNVTWNLRRITLHCSTYFSQMRATLNLLEKRGADFDKICVGWSVSALHFAVSNCPTNTVLLLLELGLKHLVNKDCPEDGARTPLMRAISDANEQTFLLLLDYGADPKAVTVLGETALHFCALSGHDHEFFAEALIRRGADVDAVDNIGRTPLLIAVGRRRFHVASALLKAGANQNHCHEGTSLLGRLVTLYDHPYLPMMYLLGPLHKYQRAQFVVKEELGWTVLHILAAMRQEGHFFRSDIKPVIEYLAEKFPSPKFLCLKDRHGRTALNLAIESRNIEVVRVLVQAGASDISGKPATMTTLREAITKGGSTSYLLELVELLASHQGRVVKSVQSMSNPERLDIFTDIISRLGIRHTKINGYGEEMAPDANGKFTAEQEVAIVSVQPPSWVRMVAKGDPGFHMLTSSIKSVDPVVITEVAALSHTRLLRSYYVNKLAGYSIVGKQGGLPFQRFHVMLLLPFGQLGSLNDYLYGDGETIKELTSEPSDQLGVCIDLVKALIDVHLSGFVHGAVNLMNAYVFKSTEEEVSQHYRQRSVFGSPPSSRDVVARLTNFEYAVHQTKYPEDHVYRRQDNDFDAPEVRNRKLNPMPFDSMRFCDTYSFGILLLQACGGSVDVFQPWKRYTSTAPEGIRLHQARIRNIGAFSLDEWCLAAAELVIDVILSLTSPVASDRPTSLADTRDLLEQALELQLQHESWQKAKGPFKRTRLVRKLSIDWWWPVAFHVTLRRVLPRPDLAEPLRGIPGFGTVMRIEDIQDNTNHTCASPKAKSKVEAGEEMDMPCEGRSPLPVQTTGGSSWEQAKLPTEPLRRALPAPTNSADISQSLPAASNEIRTTGAGPEAEVMKRPPVDIASSKMAKRRVSSMGLRKLFKKFTKNG